MNPFLIPIAKLHSGLGSFRNWLYDRGIFDVATAPSPVISVGNLTMGGTGKTPIVHFLCQELQKRGLKVTVVSRNYKARVKRFSKIDRTNPNGAFFYGDEPWLLSTKLIGVDCYVGPRKAEAALLKGYDVIVLDDGFQHRDLKRNFDLVIVDGSKTLQALQVFPLGEGRESLVGLKRASAILVTRVEGMNSDLREAWRQQLAAFSKAPVFFATSRMSYPDLTGQRVLAVSGIGNPDSFEAPIRASCAEFSALRFSDHVMYSSSDLEKITQKSMAVDYVLTTEKDIVKLGARLKIPNIVAVKLFLEIEDLHAFMEKIYEIFR